MTISQWMGYLSSSSEDSKLLAALAKVGVRKVPTIEKGSTSSRVQLKDAMLIFSSATLFPKFATGGDGTSVLTGVMLPIKRPWGAYDGDLPHDLTREDTREKLRSRFGEPEQSDDDFYWDEWNVDGRLLRVEYTEALDRLELVGVELLRD